MRKRWWPEPFYEARPYGALTLGILGGTVSAAHSVTVGGWDLPFLVAFILGCAAVAYGIVIARMRYAYRRRSRWQREKRH